MGILDTAVALQEATQLEGPKQTFQNTVLDLFQAQVVTGALTPNPLLEGTSTGPSAQTLGRRAHRKSRPCVQVP